MRGPGDVPAYATRHAAVPRPQHDEDASATPQSVDGRSGCGGAETVDDEVHSSGHRVGCDVGAPSTVMGPLKVRRNASS